MGCSDCEEDRQALRQEREDISGLPLTGDGDEQLAVDSPSACATVYVGVDTRPIGIVRVNLFAELFGVRQLVASAFAPSGFKGVAIVVTGMQVDGWHVTFQATNPTMNVKAGIQAGRGCSGFSVFVPPGLLARNPNPDGSDLGLFARNPAPFNRAQGLQRIDTNVLSGNVSTLVAGERVQGFTVAAMAALDANVAIVDRGGIRPIIVVPAGEQLHDDFDGNLEGPGTITFSNFLSWIVQTVR